MDEWSQSRYKKTETKWQASKMWPLWIWFSKLTITEEMDKQDCEKYCLDRNETLITMDLLQYAFYFKVIWQIFMNLFSDLRLYGTTSSIQIWILKFMLMRVMIGKLRFEFNLRALFIETHQIWRSGNHSIAENYWMDRTQTLVSTPRMPSMSKIVDKS